MELQKLTSASSVFQKSAVENNSLDSENSFLQSLSGISLSGIKNDLPQVYAGQGKEFEFWTKEEKVPSKTEKLKTVDDVLAQIEKLLDNLKNEK